MIDLILYITWFERGYITNTTEMTQQDWTPTADDRIEYLPLKKFKSSNTSWQIRLTGETKTENFIAMLLDSFKNTSE